MGGGASFRSGVVAKCDARIWTLWGTMADINAAHAEPWEARLEDRSLGTWKVYDTMFGTREKSRCSEDEMEGYLRYEEDADNIDVVVGLWCPGTWGLLLSLLERSSRGVGSLYHGREITTCGTSSLDSS
jgi:hypothetical protein